MKKTVCVLVLLLFTFCFVVSMIPLSAFAVDADEDKSALSFDEDNDQEEMNADKQSGEELEETRMDFSSEDGEDKEAETLPDESVMTGDEAPKDQKTE